MRTFAATFLAAVVMSFSACAHTRTPRYASVPAEEWLLIGRRWFIPRPLGRSFIFTLNMEFKVLLLGYDHRQYNKFPIHRRTAGLALRFFIDSPASGFDNPEMFLKQADNYFAEIGFFFYGGDWNKDKIKKIDLFNKQLIDFCYTLLYVAMILLYSR